LEVAELARKHPAVAAKITTPEPRPRKYPPRTGTAPRSIPKLCYTAGGVSGGYTTARTVRNVDGLRIGVTAAGEAFQTYDRHYLLRISRDFYRNNGLYKGLINRATSYIVGNGFSLQIRTPDTGWNSQAENLWQAWWKKPDVRGLDDGHGLQKMLVRELLQTGEMAALLTYQAEGYLQAVEAEQICGLNEQDNGLVVNEVTGRIEKYLVRGWDTNGLLKPHIEVPADFLAWFSDRDRPSCYRGMPPLQSVFSMLHRINDVLDSEALSWQMLAKIAVSITTKGEFDPDTGTGQVYDPDINPLDQITEGDWATIFRGQPGDEIRAIERNLPGKDFPASIRMFLRLLGVPLGLPLEFILLDWTGGNYSQSRAVMEQAYQQFEQWQKALASVLDHILDWKLREWIDAGLLPVNDYYSKHEWLTPRWPWLDQLKEAQAASLMIESGFSSYSETLKTLNKDRDEVMAQQKQETIDAINLVAEIKAITGVDVPWQPFAGRIVGKTEAAVNAGKEDAAQTSEGGAE